MWQFNLCTVRRTARFPFCIAVCIGLLAWTIVTSRATASEAQATDIIKVFQCQFNEAWDVNYDHWPDRWTRETGPEFPHYVNIGIQDDATAESGKCLRIDLDGAAAAISSPPIRVMSRFSYAFAARLKNENLNHSQARITLDFCDKSGHVLQTVKSKPIATTKGWKQIELEKIELSDPAIDRVIVNLQVKRGDKGDLNGLVSLTDVWLARLPRIAVSTNCPCNVYSELNDAVVKCELSGIRERDPEIRFQLLDSTGKELQHGTSHLNGRLIVEDAERTTEVADGVGQVPAGYEGTAEWRPQIPDYGFYRVVVQMLRPEATDDPSDVGRELDSRTVWLAAVPKLPVPMPKQGEFGWTLPQGDNPLSFQDLSLLLPQVGINWVKLPVWYAANDPQRGDELIRFVELLGASNIEVVGMIDKPPADSELASGIASEAPIAELLSLDPALWSPILEPVMTRLSLRVRWWQLGRDYDKSVAAYPDLNKRLSELRNALFRFGQDVRLGMCFDWANANQNLGQVAWDFQQNCLKETPTEEAFKDLVIQKPENTALRWVFVEPPLQSSDPSQRDEAALAARSSEFVRRLVSAKESGVDAIIVPRPFDDENGLMRASGMPGELLLPWRTTAAMLGGAKYLGQMQLPGNSENRIFVRPDHQVVMVLWNHEPTEETLYLGQDVRIVDIHGRTKPAPQAGHEQTIQVGPMPTFVLGLHEAITRWRMAANMEFLQVPSELAKSHPNTVRFQNFFPQGVGGTVRIVVPQDEHVEELLKGEGHPTEPAAPTPERWTIEPPQASFQLAAGEEGKFPFEIRLKNALFGKQPVRLDFTVEGEEHYQFSVYKQMEVGTAELELKVTTHLDKDGVLIVEQTMINKADRLSDFKCYLYAKGHRRERMQVYRLGPTLDRKIYRYPNGRELVGHEMLLEIEELNGPRVIKHRFVATETAPPEKPEPENQKDSQTPVDATSKGEVAKVSLAPTK